jgi:hypothetical protein
MKHAVMIAGDYFLNALKSAAIGALVAVVLSLAEGEAAVGLATAGAYALVGMTCGTSSKAAIEGAFSLFGTRRFLAYILNAIIIAAVICVFVDVFYQGFGGMRPWVVVLVFVLPEAASVLLVRAGVEESLRLERAFEKRRNRIESEDEPE